MSVKITVSYDNEDELIEIMKRFEESCWKMKKAKTQKGRHKNAYIEQKKYFF